MAAEAPVAEQAPAFTPAKPTLITTPVSNCAARVRFLVYKKGLEEEIAFLRPVDPPFEGLKSAAYLALNPQGKMPMLVLPDGTALPESQVIETYLVDKYAATGPSLLPPTPEARARAALAARILDLYITPVQGCMYKQMGADQRAQQIQQIALQLDALEGVVAAGPEGGPFVAGTEISFGDGALFPTFVFLTEILPRHFGVADVFAGRPRLAAWWAAVQGDAAAARVIGEMRGGLQAWEVSNRWDTLGITAQVANDQYNWSV